MSDKAKLTIGKVVMLIGILLIVVLIIQTFGDAAGGELGAQSRRLQQIPDIKPPLPPGVTRVPGINIPVPEGPSSTWDWQCKIACVCYPSGKQFEIDRRFTAQEWNGPQSLVDIAKQSCQSNPLVTPPIDHPFRDICQASLEPGCKPVPPGTFKSGPNQPDDTTPEPVLKSEPEPTPTPAPTQRPWWYFRWRYR